jgi:hypothetical protein
MFIGSVPGRAPYFPKPLPVSQNNDKSKKPGMIALGLGIGIEATSALGLTNARFNTQRNAVLGVSKNLKPSEYLKCASFFIPARLVQFFSMVEAKEHGKTFSHHMFPSASQLTHNLSGAMFSTVAGLPFSLPMEIVLIKGINAGHQGHPFKLLGTVKESVMDTLRGNIRGTKATVLRDGPYGGCAVALPELLENAFEPVMSGWSEGLKKPVCSLMAAFFYTVASHPADVIKTAIQNNSDLPDAVVKVGRQIVAERGMKALAAGLLARYLKIGFTFLMLNSIVPQIDKALKEYQQK